MSPFFSSGWAAGPLPPKLKALAIPTLIIFLLPKLHSPISRLGLQWNKFPLVNEMKNGPSAFNEFLYRKQSQTLPISKWAEALLPYAHTPQSSSTANATLNSTQKKRLPPNILPINILIAKKKGKKDQNKDTLDIATSQHQDNKQSNIFLKKKCQIFAESETSFLSAVRYKVKFKSKDNWKTIGGWQ